MNHIPKHYTVIALTLLAIFAGVIVCIYFNSVKEIKEIESVSSPVTTTTLARTGFTDEQFLEVVGGEGSESDGAHVVARGDVDGDGYEDAIIQQVSCGASCGFSLQVAFNDSDESIRLLPQQADYVQFEPAFVGSSAAKSEVTNISIKDGIISLTGKGLACFNPRGDDTDICTEEEWNVVKTVMYKYDGVKIVQLDHLP